jgi:uncharacterized membrane protein YccC
MARKVTLLRLRPNWAFFEHPARTTVAPVISLFVARAAGLPEPYWAPITTLVVTQSTLGAAWTISRQRFVGTALGAVLGALVATSAGSSTIVFGACILGIRAICSILQLGRTVYRFAGITLAIVMLVAHTEPAWTIAVHRFIEVSLGIAVALALTALWPEREQQPRA